MELDITFLTDENEIDLMDYSASAAELGQDAGRLTWNGAMDSGHVFVRTEEEKQEARDYIQDFGAWDKEEIDAWTDQELNALILQMIAGDLREYLDFRSRGKAEFDRWNENNGGRISEYEGKYWCYLGM